MNLIKSFNSWFNQVRDWKNSEKEQTALEKVEERAKRSTELIIEGKEDFNFCIFYFESVIASILDYNNSLMLLNDVSAINKIKIFLIFNSWYIPKGLDEDIRKEFLKNGKKIKEFIEEERAVVMWVIDRLLKIESVEEFGEKYYEIVNLKIDSYKDLEQNRDKLKDMYEDFKNYKIPGYEIASKYIEQTGIEWAHDLADSFYKERFITCDDECRLVPNKIS